MIKTKAKDIQDEFYNSKEVIRENKPDGYLRRLLEKIKKHNA